MVSGNDSCGVSDELLFDQDTGSAWKGSPETSSGFPRDNLGGTLNAVGWAAFRECWGPGWPLMASEASPAHPHHYQPRVSNVSGLSGVSRQDSGRWWRNKPGQDQLGQVVPSALWEDLSAEMSYRPYNLRFVLGSRM